MTRRERLILSGIYECLNRMGGMRPSNPADVRAVAVNLRDCTAAAISLQHAVFALMDHDATEAEIAMHEAQERLGLHDDGE